MYILCEVLDFSLEQKSAVPFAIRRRGFRSAYKMLPDDDVGVILHLSIESYFRFVPSSIRDRARCSASVREVDASHFENDCSLYLISRLKQHFKTNNSSFWREYFS